MTQTGKNMPESVKKETEMCWMQEERARISMHSVWLGMPHAMFSLKYEYNTVTMVIWTKNRFG